jgi:hypothetical protein
MSLLSEIKTLQLTARKNRDAIASALLTTLLGEASMPGKNDGNRESTDMEVVAVIKKFVKNTQEMIRLADNETSRKELSILESFLPKQLTEDELRRAFSEIIENNVVKNMGAYMNTLKTFYPGMYDGATASRILKELLGMQK